jgi:integral membrane sensor domain MASE1
VSAVALVVAAMVLRRLTEGRGDLARVRDVLALVACAVLAAVISGAVGPLALRLGGVIESGELWAVVRTWILGDASGVLVVAPAVLTWATAGFAGIRRREPVGGCCSGPRCAAGRSCATRSRTAC